MVDVIKIYTENNDFQYIETLRRSRAKRSKTKSFFVEGVNAINQALKYQWEIEAYVHANDIPLSDWATNIIQQTTPKKRYELPHALMEKISQKENTSELIAIVRIPPDQLERIPDSANPLIVVLDRIANPGNLGAIIRSCDALRASGLIITGHATDLYAPETVRASTGSFFAIPIVRVASSKLLVPWIDKFRGRHPHLKIIGTSARGNTPLHEYDFTKPTILLIGSENHGLSVHYREMCDVLVTIPMSGSASSMNVACATSILLYEISRQRGFGQ